MRKLNRLIAAGALAVPMALGASSIAGAEVGSLADQDLGQQELPGVNQESNEGGSGDQGAKLREEAQNLRDNAEEAAQNLRNNAQEDAQNPRDEPRGGDANSNEGDSDAEQIQTVESVIEVLTDSSVEGPGEGSPLG